MHLDEADDAIMSLRLAVGGRDEAMAWRKVTSAADALHRLEEWINKNDPDYLDHRTLTDPGKTTAALMWARGLIHHAGVDWRPVAWLPCGTLRQKQSDGTWEEVTLRQQQSDGTWRDLLAGTRPHVLHLAWPERVGLPPPERTTDRYGRDVLYDKLIAGRSVMDPVDTARYQRESESSGRKPRRHRRRAQGAGGSQAGRRRRRSEGLFIM